MQENLFIDDISLEKNLISFHYFSLLEPGIFYRRKLLAFYSSHYVLDFVLKFFLNFSQAHLKFSKFWINVDQYRRLTLFLILFSHLTLRNSSYKYKQVFVSRLFQVYSIYYPLSLTCTRLFKMLSMKIEYFLFVCSGNPEIYWIFGTGSPFHWSSHEKPIPSRNNWTNTSWIYNTITPRS